jgi:hypothetical protein
MSFNHLHTGRRVYQFIHRDEIQAFEWIKENTSPDAVFVTAGHPKGEIGGGGNSFSWWVEGYCKRLCIPSGNLKYYSYQSQRDEVRIANRIFRGRYSIEYDNIRVTESFPTEITNPEIAVYIDDDYDDYADYQDIIKLNDGQHQLFFYTNENEQILDNPVPFFSQQNISSNIKYSDTMANLTFTYEEPNFELIRSVILGEKKSSVDVIFQILPKNLTLGLFKINLWALFAISSEECEILEDNSVILTTDQFNHEIIQTKIKVIETNGKVESAKVLYENLWGSRPVISYSLKPSQDNLYVRIRIVVESSIKDTEYKEKLDFYDSYILIKNLNVDYILVNKGRELQFRRFLLEPEHFYVEKYYNSIFIFRVMD